MKMTNGSRISNLDTAAASSAASAAETSGPDVPIKNAPATHSVMPIRLTLEMVSCRNTCANIADSTTLHAPNGATSDAGAYANAAKLPISPAAIKKVPIHQVGLRKNANPVLLRDEFGKGGASVGPMFKTEEVADDVVLLLFDAECI